MENQYDASVDGGDGVGSSKTHFYSRNVHFFREMHYGRFHTFHNDITAYSTVLFRSRYNQVDTSDGYFLMLFLELLKVVWILVTPNIPPIKLIVALMVVVLCHLGVWKIHL